MFYQPIGQHVKAVLITPKTCENRENSILIKTKITYMQKLEKISSFQTLKNKDAC